jgi:hypothetical protein
MAADEVNDQDAALLERLGAISRIVDPVPDHVVELGKAAFGFRDPDRELMQMVSRPVDPSLVRAASASASSHLHFFEHGALTIDLEVTVRGGFASMVGVVTDTDTETGSKGEGPTVVVESAEASTTLELEEGRFTAARLPVGLVRLVLRREGKPPLSTGWFELG